VARFWLGDVDLGVIHRAGHDFVVGIDCLLVHNLLDFLLEFASESGESIYFDAQLKELDENSLHSAS